MPKSTCTVDACPHPVQARGMCRRHYRRWASHGTVDLPIVECHTCGGPAARPRHRNRGLFFCVSCTPCLHQQCCSPAVQHGLCSPHYEQVVRGPSTLCVDCMSLLPGTSAKRCRTCRADLAREKAAAKFTPKPDETRICVDCDAKYEAPASDTRSVQCAACRAVRNRTSNATWGRRNRDRYTEIQRNWRRANADRVKVSKHNSRVRRRDGIESESFTRTEIFERDGWVCQLCMQPVDPTLRWPDHWSATLDHIIPLAKKGPNTRANSQLAHATCNRRKGANTWPLGALRQQQCGSM